MLLKNVWTGDNTLGALCGKGPHIIFDAPVRRWNENKSQHRSVEEESHFFSMLLFFIKKLK
jgi:hypothetical protein